jgi:hypothetical protein
MRTVIVSGTDDRMFLMACTLAQSLKRWAPDLPFYLLDFGLSEGLRDFAAKQFNLIARPAALASGLHPYTYKASTGQYLDAVAWDHLLWLDADTLAVGPLSEPISHLFQTMIETKASVAASANPGTIGSFLRDYRNNTLLEPFERAIRQYGISDTEPYYSVGAVGFLPGPFLSEWRRRTDELGFHTCFEQNAFNLLAKEYGILKLPAHWHVFDVALRNVIVADDQLTLGGHRVLLLHLASPQLSIISSCEATLTELGWIPLPSRRFSRHRLRRIHQGYLEAFVQEHRSDLAIAGLLPT